ncbi:prepilin peptidase [Thermoproteota archaeon]
MPLELFFAIIIVLVLLIGSYTDIKTREVPDWVNYAFIVTALGVRVIWSAASYDWVYIAEGVLGLLACVALAYAMFYAGQWGGGDAKMIMGLGAMIGLDLHINSFLLGFVINTFIVGAVYALLFSVYLAIKNRDKFKKEFKKLFYTRKVMMMRKMIIISAAIMLIVIFFVNINEIKAIMLALVILYVATFYLWIFVRIIERSSMYKKVTPDKLTEGDWIAKDVFVAGKRICGPKDLGISIEQINKLKRFKKQKKINKILIKEGIPFVPSFLLAFGVTWVWGNLLILFL